MQYPASLAPALLAVAVAGCSPLPPAAQCFADATIEYRAAWRGVRAIDGDLARGYRLRHESLRVARAVPCRREGRPSTCLANATERLDLPVPIDTKALRVRREALVSRMDRLRPSAMAAAAPCGYGDWTVPPALAVATPAATP